MNFSTYSNVLAKSRFRTCFYAFAFLLITGLQAWAQQGNISVNSLTPTPFVNGSTPAFTVVGTPSATITSFWSNSGRIIDNTLTNSATATIIAGSATYRVVDATHDYSAGNFAGFLIQNNAIAGLSILGGVTVRTYLDGNLRETSSSATLVGLGSSLVSGAFEVGINTTLSYDEIGITFSGIASSYAVFYPVQRAYAQGPSFTCNTPTSLALPTYPAAIAGATGVSGVSIGSVNNSFNAIDNDPNSYAEIAFLVGVGGSADISIQDRVKNYPAGTYTGFDIQNTALLQANLLGGLTISTYKDGNATAEESFSGNQLISVGSSLLSGNVRQQIGFITTKEFDEVRLTLTLSGVSLGTTRVYGAIFETFCAGTIACDNTYLLTSPSFPVVVNSANTGITGVACAACSISDPANVVSASNTDYSRVTITAGVAANASLSVVNPIDTYPIGTIAGFIVRPVSSSIAQVDLLNSITISTYNNGTLQETKTGASLLNLELLGAITVGTGTPTNVSIVTTKVFDEIKIQFSSLAGVLNSNDVYGAFVDTRSVADGSVLGCGIVKNPDINVTQISVPVSGNVSTNDKVPAGTTYGPTATANPGNPAGGVLILNTNGTYTFTGSTAGVYTYQVPACAPTFACTNVPLVITVKDPTKATNSPVANTDVVATAGNATTPLPLTINVKANDGPGNAGGTLGDPTPTTPAHGTVSVSGGNVIYTPNAAFYGQDSFTYSICETPSGLCQTATVYVTVKQPSTSNKTYAADDYVATAFGVTATGNVSTNDTDPEGNSHTVTTQSISNANGVFTLAANGDFTFVPASTFSGPLEFPYTTCDNGTPSACASATLYLIVNPLVASTAPDFNVTSINVQVLGSVTTNDKVPAGTTYGPALAGVSNPTGGTLLLNSNGTYTFTGTTIGVYSYTVPACVPDVTPCTSVPLVITVNDPTKTTNPPIANTDVATVLGNASTPGSVTINVKSNDGAGNKNGVLGAPVPSTPAHGTTSVVGGNIVYTPTAGYYGSDVFTYSVCESPSTTCATATVYVTIKQPGSVNTTSAADDYGRTDSGGTIVGNVSSNDTDPEGQTQTVTPQSTTTTPKGTFTLLSNGNYTFVPATGITGPAEFAYTTCDSGTPSACTSATLYLVVADSPLPVTLTSFTASKEGQVAQLKWSTTEETNSDRFEIERSQNGKNWDLIGTQVSNGESTSLKNYNFSDAKPLNGENLYRLKMIDKDATYAYSRIQSLTFDGDLQTSFYPNPVAEKLIIETANFALVKSVKIFDANGKTVYQSSTLPTNQINVQNLSAGLYIVQVISKSGAVISHKVIKQ